MKKETRSNVIAAILFVLSIFLLSEIYQPMTEASATNKQLIKELQDVKQTNNNLKNSIDLHVSGGEKREDSARKVYHLSEPGELLFVFPNN